ncbi:MAG: hypothetical protein DRR08_24420 [Candidatus Parabeggiatoa sp. nov. 2]|nr:MAG: hypothetical protein B6247_25150 [Beggiatoa sp. 4572_84]RKZ55418.1 MAG: hypothetical protein DRR08_24420 [Gammaproteobacteria bacterium]
MRVPIGTVPKTRGTIQSSLEKGNTLNRKKWEPTLKGAPINEIDLSGRIHRSGGGEYARPLEALYNNIIINGALPNRYSSGSSFFRALRACFKSALQPTGPTHQGTKLSSETLKGCSRTANDYILLF